ncbi:MAG: ribonuclease HI [Rubrivivax sp.]|nr:MAG: ribonuclease HI [Rubrivivax sp.]
MTTTNTERPPVIIYTDGACKGNPGPGGWGVYMHNGTKTKELCGGEPGTTNNRMELTAAIKALEFFKTPRRLTIHSDSEYLVKGMTERLAKWVLKGWRTTAEKPVINQDLWERLRVLAAGHEVTWAWVKGHAGNLGNERADALANRGMAARGAQRLTSGGVA